MYEIGGRYTGRWYRASGAFSASTEIKVSWTQDEIPNGISHSSGDFTILQPGRWRLTANLVGPNASTATSGRIGTATDTWSSDFGRAAATGIRFSLCTELALPTGQVFSVYITPGSITAPSTSSPLTAQSFNFTATYVGPM